MIAYADTNFFTRLYLPLADSDEASRLFAQAQAAASPPLPVTWLHRLEIINAFQLQVFAGSRHGQLRVTSEQAAAAHATFRTDLLHPAFLRPVHLSPDRVEEQFEELALRHTAKHGFRTYDVIHVASALLLACDTFWSFDPKASRLAALEGLRTR
ncbi:MAG: type II toxin-antitoxin system VapC family toxin [Verrucomicrobia bacterium]|nr:type II toxin-antitoxin system VapC family toxin [Verrucomicrobiota bacterium]